MTKGKGPLRHLTIPLVILSGLLLGGCQTTEGGGTTFENPFAALLGGGKSAQANEGTEVAQVETPEEQWGEQMAPIGGPKRTIAVGKFGTVGAFTQKYGHWHIGGGLGAMLTTELIESDRFIVLERAQLADVLGEQELKASGLTTPESGPKLGRITGAQYLIYGEVTEFGAGEEGGGFSFGLSRGGPFKLGGSIEKATGNVAMDIRIVDTTTGEIVENYKVSKKIEESAFALNVTYSGMSLGGDKFKKTPLGKAARLAIHDAISGIGNTVRARPWTGLVVGVDNGDVIINAGSSSGLTQGDTFAVNRVVKTFTDPATGQVLGTKDKEIGVLIIDSVQAKISFGTFAAHALETPIRGDIVKAR